MHISAVIQARAHTSCAYELMSQPGRLCVKVWQHGGAHSGLKVELYILLHANSKDLRCVDAETVLSTSIFPCRKNIKLYCSFPLS